MNQEQAQKYVKDGGTRCPECGSRDIESVNDDSYDVGSIHHRALCGSCGAGWLEVYQLGQVLELDGSEPNKVFCENPLCDHLACKTVRVSVESAGDQERQLCAACEEAWSWGVQHGRFMEQLCHDLLYPEETEGG